MTHKKISWAVVDESKEFGSRSIIRRVDTTHIEKRQHASSDTRHRHDDCGEAFQLRWLDSVTVDSFTLKDLVLWLEASYATKKLVAREDLVHSVTNRFRNTYDVLEKLQALTGNEGDCAPELRELLQDLVFDADRLRNALNRFASEDFLYQLIRNQKLLKYLEQAHDGVDAFVDGVQQSRFGESFDGLAAKIGVSIESKSQAYWHGELSRACRTFARQFELRDPVTCPILDAKMQWRISKRTLWTLGFEKQRLRRLGISNPMVDLAERELYLFKDEASEMRLWFIPSDEIVPVEDTGNGDFWREFRATWGGSAVVAVKIMVKFDKQILLHEMGMWNHLKHPHILQFYGATYLDSDCSIVTEFASYGKLTTYLAHPDRKRHTWRLLYEAALGVHYLHQAGYVHANLNCSIILVGDDLKAKLTGFTLSFKNSEHKHVQCSVAFQWLAPECFDHQRERSFPSDVYSFGMCIVEALTLRPPWRVTEGAAVRRFVKRGTLPVVVSKLAPEVQKLIKAMCAREPSERIGIEEVIARLKEFEDATNQPRTPLTSEPRH